MQCSSDVSAPARLDPCPAAVGCMARGTFPPTCAQGPRLQGETVFTTCSL